MYWPVYTKAMLLYTALGTHEKVEALAPPPICSREVADSTRRASGSYSSLPMRVPQGEMEPGGGRGAGHGVSGVGSSGCVRLSS